MHAYTYQAAFYCEPCATAIRAKLASAEDSDAYPQGPFANGGGEADTPQHCDACGAFLENPLTPDGVIYTQDALDNGTDGHGNAEVLAQWAEFYGLTPRYWFSTSSGHFTLRITRDDAETGSHQGRCDDDIADLRTVPYIAEQLAALDPQHLAGELREYGAWDASELADHDANLSRILWLACGDIVENIVLNER